MLFTSPNNDDLVGVVRMVMVVGLVRMTGVVGVVMVVGVAGVVGVALSEEHYFVYSRGLFSAKGIDLE